MTEFKLLLAALQSEEKETNPDKYYENLLDHYNDLSRDTKVIIIRHIVEEFDRREPSVSLREKVTLTKEIPVVDPDVRQDKRMERQLKIWLFKLVASCIAVCVLGGFALFGFVNFFMNSGDASTEMKQTISILKLIVGF